MSRIKRLVSLSLILTIALVIWAFESAPSRTVAERTDAEKTVDNDWTIISRNLIDRFNQIQFIDESHGWGMSSHALWKTSDGGQTWMQVRRAQRVKLLENHQPEAVLWKMQFLSSTEGWLLEGDKLLHTLDAGASWKTQGLNNVLIRSFAFLDSDHGWIVGANLRSTLKDGIEDARSVIYTTIDGGSRWRNLSVNSMDGAHRWRLLDVAPVLPNNAWVVGDVILQCSISANNCNEVSIVPDVYGVPSKVQFCNSTVGWITTNQGNKFLVTSDAGKSWDVRSAPTENGGFKDLVYSTSGTAWGIMSDAIYESQDGGKSWTKAAEGMYSSIQYLKSSNIVFAAGDTVIKYRIP